MRAIKPGDVYFLKSPIKMADPVHEKKLAYLLNTVSARPVVVIKAPQFWDDYSTVTVLPALTDAKNAITFHMIDRYGLISESDYPVTPHTPHSIPVSRLSRYIGTLDDEELEELLYAFKWIHDENMQRTEPVPKCYQKVMGEGVIIPKARNRKRSKPTPTIYVDSQNVLHIKDAFGTSMDINTPIEDVPADVNTAENDFIYEDDTNGSTEEAVTQPNSKIITGVNKFPKSIFSETDLLEVANRFDIDPDFYESSDSPIVKKDIKCITENEMQIIMQNVGPIHQQVIIDLYNAMYPVDALLFGPHLPTPVLKRLTALSYDDTAALKRLCSFLRDIPEESYKMRLEREEKEEHVTNPEPDEFTHQYPAEDWRRRFNEATRMIPNTKNAAKMAAPLKPYLNSRDLPKLPEKFYELFLRMPRHIVQKSFVGKGFQTVYTTEYARIKSIIMTKYQNGEM